MVGLCFSGPMVAVDGGREVQGCDGGLWFASPFSRVIRAATKSDAKQFSTATHPPLVAWRRLSLV